MPIYDMNGNPLKAYDIDGNEVSGKEIITRDAEVGFMTTPEYRTIDNDVYRLVWIDEFNEKDIDKNYWTDSYFVSNVENMYQAQADYYIADSILHMRIKKDAPSRGTAADTAQSCIQSGEYNGDLTDGSAGYHDVHPFWGLLTQEGYYEMRMKPWKSTGGCCNVWWLMEIQDAKYQKAGVGGRGEFDIIEYLPMNPTVYPHGQHKNSNEALTEIYVNTDVGIDLTNDYHVIGFLWKNGTVVFYLDDNVVDTFTNISTPQTPMYHILSAYKYFGTGTDWKGSADRSLDTRDVTWDIDYIRIYKKADTEQTTDITIDWYVPIIIDGNTADMEIDSRRGCPYEFPSYVYVYWSDGTRTEHWVKWDAIRDSYRNKMANEENFEWPGYVYGVGIDIVANIHYTKTVSILGDSISTFQGYIPQGSNDYYRPTTWNQAWTVSDTWWMKVINNYDYELEVNNSSGATSVSDRTSNINSSAGCQHRSMELGSPDIIIVYMGINDFGGAVPIGDYSVNSMDPKSTVTFKESYALMLHRIKKKYPNARLLCARLLQSEYDGGKKTAPGYNSANVSIVTYNSVISEVATAYGAEVIPLDSCGITWDNRSSYMIDYSSSTKVGVHPNKSGMTLIADGVINVIDN